MLSIFIATPNPAERPEFMSMTPDDYQERSGILTNFLILGKKDSMKENLEAGYKFPCNWNADGKFTANGTYSYPEDADMYLYPLVELSDGKQWVWIYEFGMVGFLSYDYPQGIMCMMD